MSQYISTFFGGNTSATPRKLTAFVRTTRTFPVPSWAKKATVVIHGSGGSGALGSGAPTSATGGNSGPWGQVTFDVLPAQTLVINIGAGGVQKAAPAGNGNAGSSSTVVLDGVTKMTVPGGEGGVYKATAGAVAATPSAAVTGADFWVPGLPASDAPATVSGGAASNVFYMSASELIASGIPGRHVGMPGNVPPSTPLMGVIHPNIPVLFFSTTVGHPGVGGDAGISAAVGLFAGGHGYTGLSSLGCKGGQGGGGGGGAFSAINNSGGDALGYVVFTE